MPFSYGLNIKIILTIKILNILATHPLTTASLMIELSSNKQPVDLSKHESDLHSSVRAPW